MNSRTHTRGVRTRWAAAAGLVLTAGLLTAPQAAATPAPAPAQAPAPAAAPAPSATQAPTLAQLVRLSPSELSARIRRNTRGPITYRWREVGAIHTGRHVPSTRARRVDSSGGSRWISRSGTFCFSREWQTATIPGYVLEIDPTKPWSCGPRGDHLLGEFLIVRAKRVDPGNVARQLMPVPETRPRIVTHNGRRLVRARFVDGLRWITVWVDRRARIQRMKIDQETVVTVTRYRAAISLPPVDQRGPLASYPVGPGPRPPAPTDPPSTDPPPSNPN